jgi:hypothetical protein
MPAAASIKRRVTAETRKATREGGLSIFSGAEDASDTP